MTINEFFPNLPDYFEINLWKKINKTKLKIPNLLHKILANFFLRKC